MKKMITQIRDLDLIEEELNSSSAGVFSFISNEKIYQTAATYIYRNKNVYLFISESEEFHFNIKLDSEAGFAILKHEYKKSGTKGEFTYTLLSISIIGTVKNLTDQKLIDEAISAYRIKYGKRPEQSRNEILPAVKIIVLDSQEIHAFEETGG